MVLELPSLEREEVNQAIIEAETRGIGTGGVVCSLTEEHLWSDFNNITNEMIVTKLGRRMFPVVKVNFKGLDIQSMYRIVIKFTQLDNHRWKFVSGDWCKGGKAEPPPPLTIYEHTESPNFGHHWMKEPVSFSKLKVTNKPNQNGHITLNSLHRYEISVIVLTVDKSATTIPMSITKFPQCNFIAVTAYQNDTLTGMKIRHNPFAKAFLDVTTRGSGNQHNHNQVNHRDIHHHDHHPVTSTSIVQPTSFDQHPHWYLNDLGTIRNLMPPAGVEETRLPMLGTKDYRAMRQYGFSQESQSMTHPPHHYQTPVSGNYDQILHEWLQSSRQVIPQSTPLPQNSTWNSYANSLIGYMQSPIENRMERFQDTSVNTNLTQACSLVPSVACHQDVRPDPNIADDKHTKEYSHDKTASCSPNNLQEFTQKQNIPLNSYPYDTSFNVSSNYHVSSHSSTPHEFNDSSNMFTPFENNEFYDRSPVNTSPLSTNLSSHCLMYPAQSSTTQFQSFTHQQNEESEVLAQPEFIGPNTPESLTNIKDEFQYIEHQNKVCDIKGHVHYMQPGS